MWRALSMSANKPVRRLRLLANTLVSPALRPVCTTDGTVSIGDVSIKLRPSPHPELVPVKYVSEDLPQMSLRSLRWIMQKDKLGQDVFLIGPPGPIRRGLAMQYLELTNSETEYVALSRDTTESDLKQRREIHASTAYYVDQCAVRAAVEGRVLVLEGIEKAERNVLPVLNNLLENREMQLEDGRFLMSASRYDTLLKEHSKEELDAWKLVRVSENFRVIALGLPVPRYHGNPLDPPLRSRFQARDISLLPYKDQLSALQAACPGVPQERLAHLVSFAQTLQSSELSSVGLPDFPMHNLVNLAKIMCADPGHSLGELLHRLYPHHLMLGEEGQRVVEDTLKTFHLGEKSEQPQSSSVADVTMPGDHPDGVIRVQLNKGSHQVYLDVPAGDQVSLAPSEVQHKKFVMTPSHSQLLCQMLESHAVHDFCLVGPKGCGKSVLLHQFARMLGYRIEPVVLYQDMTSRDLLQQRITLSNGDTSWRPSPLVTAALEGHIAELDGIHRVNPGTLTILQRLVHDRELHLYDGSRLLRHNRYDVIKQKQGWSDDDMVSRGIYRIHPAFRIAGLAEPPVFGSSQPQWLNSEILSMFMFHHVKPLTRDEEAKVIYEMVPEVPRQSMDQLLNLVDKLRNSTDPAVTSVASSLSTRQLLRIASRLAEFPEECLSHSVNKACLSRFLPKLPAASLDNELRSAGILKEVESDDAVPQAVTTCEVRDDRLHIGQTSATVYNPDNRAKVPDVLFYEIPQHLAIMEDMLKDFSLGGHLLLVGNQGVGKNKIVDRFLHLLNRPREYIQLHRDTTVQSLTLQPTVQDGLIIYEDSPLVRAVKFGHVLVVDEADKAATHVTCILKSLVESGEMVLGDGRRIVSGEKAYHHHDVIHAHPDFRMIVLANRPGFPFLGNDFFSALGDIFSCHAVDNPDFKSEMAMLRQYGPSVSEEVLIKLVSAFGELRTRADQGLISYPYSTREVVSVVKHLQAFPDEGVASVVRNVFDFDTYHEEIRNVVIEVMHKHGIPVGATSGNVHLSKEFPLPRAIFCHHWNLAGEGSKRDGAIKCPVEERKLKITGPIEISAYKRDLDRIADRSLVFTEQLGHYDLPMHEGSHVGGVAVGPGDMRGDWIHTLALDPVSLLSMQSSQHSVITSDLFELFPQTFFRHFPQIKMAALGEKLIGQVVLYDRESNVLVQIDPKNKSTKLITFQSMADNAKQKLTRHFSIAKDDPKFMMCSHFSHENWVVVFQEDSNKMDVIDLMDGVTQHITFPFVIGQFHPFSRDLWFLGETGTDRKYFLVKPYPEAPIPCILYPVSGESSQNLEEPRWRSISPEGMSSEMLQAALGNDKRARSNRLAIGGHEYATIVVAEPDRLVGKAPVSFYTIPRDVPNEQHTTAKDSFRRKDIVTLDSVRPVCFPATGQVIRLVPDSLVPPDPDFEKSSPVPPGTIAHLEIVDLARRSARYLPFYGSQRLSVYARYSDAPVYMAASTSDGLVTVDAAGRVRLWETAVTNLERSLEEWKNLIGKDSQGALQVTYSRDSGEDVSSPKHGKVDPDNAPHVGGNTWAGGTGGRDTAGLGGKGGPYRLDAGHDVHQLSDEEKGGVPEEVKQAAREVARRAFKERLREIQMSEYDAEMYEDFLSRVRRQVQSLRVILDSLQAKSKERVWIRHQTSGELDDTKLIDGLAGERAIYKKRGDEEPEPGSPQRIPKRLRFVVDVSGSMYRFNGLDRRLERMMEAACLVMEAFHQYEDRIKYDIVGHSGESPEIPFVSCGSVPKNNRERLDVMKQMHAHAQYCMSGDHTLEATVAAVKRVATEEADEHFVVVLSDANLSRYGISANQFARVLTSDAKVNAFAIFIGSLGNQADRLVKNLPSGHAFQCLDTKLLPQVLQQIFTSSLLNTR